MEKNSPQRNEKKYSISTSTCSVIRKIHPLKQNSLHLKMEATPKENKNIFQPFILSA